MLMFHHVEPLLNTFLPSGTFLEDSDAAKDLPHRNWQCVLWSKVLPTRRLQVLGHSERYARNG